MGALILQTDHYCPREPGPDPGVPHPAAPKIRFVVQADRTRRHPADRTRWHPADRIHREALHQAAQVQACVALAPGFRSRQRRSRLRQTCPARSWAHRHFSQ